MGKTIKTVMAGALTIGVLSNCATVTRGTTEDVQFKSNPAGATVTTSLGLSCTTPCALEVKRKQVFDATMTMGNKSVKVPVRTKTGAGGVATTTGNVIAGGLIGVGVDAASGAALDHYPNPVYVDFTGDQPRLVQAKK